MKKYGLEAIKYCKKALAVMESKEDKAEYWQAIFNLRFSCAKIYSRFFDKDQKKQFDYLESSFREYQALKDFHKETITANPKFEVTETME